MRKESIDALIGKTPGPGRDSGPHSGELTGHVSHHGTGSTCEGCGEPLCVNGSACPRAGEHLLSDHLSAEETALRQLADDLNAEFARRSPAGIVERYRREIPQAVADITQVVVDNPAQVTLMVAGMVVLSRAAANIVKPKTPLEALALMVVLQVGLPLLGAEAVKRRWLRFKVRDADGNLVPLERGNEPTGSED